MNQAVDTIDETTPAAEVFSVSAGARICDGVDFDDRADRRVLRVRAVESDARRSGGKPPFRSGDRHRRAGAIVGRPARSGFDLSVAGGVSLAVVIATHVPDGNNSCCWPAVLMAVGCALAAGLDERSSGRLHPANAIIATIGVNALLYGAVFAVSGGMPRITTPLLAEIAGGRHFRHPKLRLFRDSRIAGGFVSF